MLLFQLEYGYMMTHENICLLIETFYEYIIYMFYRKHFTILLCYAVMRHDYYHTLVSIKFAINL